MIKSYKTFIRKEKRGRDDIICAHGKLSWKDTSLSAYLKRVDFQSTREALSGCIKEINSKYTLVQGFKMLLLQYMEDLSDRELGRFLKENIASKYFCDFALEVTPTHADTSRQALETTATLYSKHYSQILIIIRSVMVGRVE